MAEGQSLLKQVTMELEQPPGTAQPQAWVLPPFLFVTISPGTWLWEFIAYPEQG